MRDDDDAEFHANLRPTTEPRTKNLQPNLEPKTYNQT